MPNNPNQLVECFVELSSKKERSTLEHSVAKTLSQLLVCDLFLLQLHNSRGEFSPHICFWQSVNNTQGTSQGTTQNKLQNKPELQDDALKKNLLNYLEQLESVSPEASYSQGGRVFWPLYLGDNCLDVIVIDRITLASEELNLLSAFGAIFTNFMALLDAGERDALTELYNRRVFDTRLDALMGKTSVNKAGSDERRLVNKQVYNFLGIIDIDFFKRVNDDFGHLFGDEVLLWLAQQMRACFRNEDSLFRYGGEEFAVLLAGLSQQQAQDTFERFRKGIAATSFPQIGQITVSIGYTKIDSQANPTLVFGEADQALYYAKKHGRNRVDSYAQLASEGLLENEREKKEIELF